MVASTFVTSLTLETAMALHMSGEITLQPGQWLLDGKRRGQFVGFIRNTLVVCWLRTIRNETFKKHTQRFSVDRWVYLCAGLDLLGIVQHAPAHITITELKNMVARFPATY